MRTCCSSRFSKDRSIFNISIECPLECWREFQITRMSTRNILTNRYSEKGEEYKKPKVSGRVNVTAMVLPPDGGFSGSNIVPHGMCFFFSPVRENTQDHTISQELTNTQKKNHRCGNGRSHSSYVKKYYG